MQKFDVIVIGGGQSGLALGYYLRRSNLSYVILDKEQHAGGAWQYAWKSLRLFSPAQWSSLPGMIMPGGPDYYPTRQETINYLITYEDKYKLNVQRPVDVETVEVGENGYLIKSRLDLYEAKVVISATGSFRKPFIPPIEGLASFQGEVIHSSQYHQPERFSGKRVLVVGEGNSGAQILAEVSQHALCTWASGKIPAFLPDHVDGRFLFDAATQMYESQRLGKQYIAPSLGNIVVVPSVAEARKRGAYASYSQIQKFKGRNVELTSGEEKEIDSVIFCTGFKPALAHLERLGVIEENGRVMTNGTKATKRNGLWLVGYGNWTGFASATLIGVGRTARQTVREVTDYITRIS